MNPCHRLVQVAKRHVIQFSTPVFSAFPDGRTRTISAVFTQFKGQRDPRSNGSHRKVALSFSPAESVDLNWTTKSEPISEARIELTKQNDNPEKFPTLFFPPPLTIATIRNTPLPNQSRSLIQDGNRSFKPPLRLIEKHPDALQCIRHHQPGQIPLIARMANPNARILLRPLEHGYRHGPVPSRRHDPFHDLILRLGGEVEQRLEADE